MNDLKRFDCTNGHAQHCYGCYQMTPNDHGDYVEYDAHVAELDRLRAELAEARKVMFAAKALSDKLPVSREHLKQYHAGRELIDLRAAIAAAQQSTTETKP